MKPRYTDSHKYPNGYVPAAATDISKLFARVRAQLKAEAAKPKAVVRSLKVKA